MCQVNIHLNWKMAKRYYIFDVTHSLKETLGIIFLNVLCYTICLMFTFPFSSCEYIFPNISDHNPVSHKNPSDYREERCWFLTKSLRKWNRIYRNFSSSLSQLFYGAAMPKNSYLQGRICWYSCTLKSETLLKN